MVYNLNKILPSFLLAISLSILTGCGGGSGAGINDGSNPNNKPADNTGQTNDTKSPKLELIGGDLIRVDIGSVFTDPGSKAYDDVDGDLTSSILITPKTIDTSAKGEYEIVYTVSDKAGNSKSKKRKVIVRQKIESIPNDTGIIINELLAANASTNLDDDFKQFSDWIELYNSSDSEVDISGFYLSDDTSNPKKWKIPNGTKKIASHEYLLIWADKQDKKDKALHTNFKLSDDAESLTLANRAGNVIDFIEYGEQDGDISCAKVNNSIVYMQPTPKSVNSQTYSELKHSKKPKFSLESGFYDGTQTLVLTQKNGGDIYYTTDGSIPTKNAKRYTQPITINKTTVVRVRAYENDKLLSNVKNRTFLINEDISLPVVSIAIDHKYLYDDKIGIYVNGTDDNGNPNPAPAYDHANFYKKWLRPASIEYFKDKKREFSENIGIRIYGAGSRVRAQKSLAIYAKSQFGAKSIKYPLFPDKPQIKKVKSFLLRNSGGDVHLLMRDALTQEIIRNNMDIDYQSYHPVVTFINGKYWGILNLREKLNEDYVEANHDVDADNIDMIGERGAVSAGSDNDYKALINFIKNNSLSNAQNYQAVIRQIDLDEYINYNITEIFVGNWDWPIKNIKYWKEQASTGKWRWILYDTDDGYGAMRPFDDNTFSFLLDTESAANSKESRILLTKLLENSDFKNRFLSRFTTHLNLTFKQERIRSLINKLKAPLAPEVDRHFNRWVPDEPRLSNYSFSDWSERVDGFTKIGNGATSRAEYLRVHMNSYFGTSGSKFLQIAASSNGTVYVDGVKLTEDYNGKYFNNAKVTLKAVPNEGHSFTRWSNGNTNLEITVTLTDNISIQAEFN